MERVEVVDAKTWCQFAQQETGTDFYYKSSFKMVGVHAKRFFNEYPGSTWSDFARVVNWAKDRPKFKPAHVGVLASCWPYAVKDGYYTSESLHGYDVDDMIYVALDVEEDERWRSKLFASVGNASNARTYEQWKNYRRRL